MYTLHTCVSFDYSKIHKHSQSARQILKRTLFYKYVLATCTVEEENILYSLYVLIDLVKFSWRHLYDSI